MLKKIFFITLSVCATFATQTNTTQHISIKPELGVLTMIGIMLTFFLFIVMLGYIWSQVPTWMAEEHMREQWDREEEQHAVYINEYMSLFADDDFVSEEEALVCLTNDVFEVEGFEPLKLRVV